ncbi:MAG: hypothetical protein PHH11_10100 [Methylomonas sp.]|nr:hypothetical protein [Methylomonas sp.]
MGNEEKQNGMKPFLAEVLVGINYGAEEAEASGQDFSAITGLITTFYE